MNASLHYKSWNIVSCSHIPVLFYVFVVYKDLVLVVQGVIGVGCFSFCYGCIPEF